MIYRPEITDIGSTLIEKAVDVYSVEGREIVSRWYHSRYDIDCMLWFYDQSELVRFQININGQVVDWSFLNGISLLQTGLISEEELHVVDDVQFVERIIFDKVVNRRAVETVMLLLHSVAGFRADWIMQISAALRHGLEKEKEKSGGAIVEPRKTRQAPFWQRLKRWAVR